MNVHSAKNRLSAGTVADSYSYNLSWILIATVQLHALSSYALDLLLILLFFIDRIITQQTVRTMSRSKLHNGAYCIKLTQRYILTLIGLDVTTECLSHLGHTGEVVSVSTLHTHTHTHSQDSCMVDPLLYSLVFCPHQLISVSVQRLGLTDKRSYCIQRLPTDRPSTSHYVHQR